jgi:hypothetical protein
MIFKKKPIKNILINKTQNYQYKIGDVVYVHDFYIKGYGIILSMFETTRKKIFYVIETLEEGPDQHNLHIVPMENIRKYNNGTD